MTAPAPVATWTVIGAGSILPRAGYGCSGYALSTRTGESVTLVDCGPGTIRSLAACGLRLADVRRVLVSHFHPDHCLDLLALAFARGNPAFEAPPLELVGPRGLRELLDDPPARIARWVTFEDTRVTEVEPAGEVQRLERDGRTLSWVATGHTPEAVAWRVDLEDGASVAYTGDTGEVPQVAELARDVELLVCECSFPDPADSGEEGPEKHLTPTSAARLARDAGCERLLLTHFYPSNDPERAAERAAATFAGRIELARDGSRHLLVGARRAQPPHPR